MEIVLRSCWERTRREAQSGESGRCSFRLGGGEKNDQLLMIHIGEEILSKGLSSDESESGNRKGPQCTLST